MNDNFTVSSGASTEEDVNSIREKINQLNWIHQIDLGNGIVTPGRWPPHPLIIKAFDSLDFNGKKVLDVGAWDGLWSFEAERRGARLVYATDDISQRSYSEQSTFQLAHTMLNSQVKYNPHINVYNISEFIDEKFDVIIFCGVYYHLRYPLKAIAELRKLCNVDAIIIVEGDVILGDKKCYANFFYNNWHYDDPSNWWVPTLSCLSEWLQSSYFDLENTFVFSKNKSLKYNIKKFIKYVLRFDNTYISRAVVTARAKNRADSNYCFPEPDFIQFDMNDYA